MHVHNWFIRSLFWPSTQCISTNTSLSSTFTFIRHLNRKPWTELELGEAAETLDPCSCVLEVLQGTSVSFSESCFALAFSPLLGGSVRSCAGVGSTLSVVGASASGALGSSWSCRLCSRRFCRAWTQVFSTAVRNRLSSESQEGTRLCSTWGQSATLSYRACFHLNRLSKDTAAPLNLRFSNRGCEVWPGSLWKFSIFNLVTVEKITTHHYQRIMNRMNNTDLDITCSIAERFCNRKLNGTNN